MHYFHASPPHARIGAPHLNLSQASVATVQQIHDTFGLLIANANVVAAVDRSYCRDVAALLVAESLPLSSIQVGAVARVSY